MHGGFAYLQDISGRDMGRVACSNPFLPGSTLSVGGKDVEIDSTLSKSDFKAGKPFLKTTVAAPPVKAPNKPLPKPKSVPFTKKSIELDKEEARKTSNVAVPTTLATKGGWKNPLKTNTIMPKTESKEPAPRHDPKASGAIVMKRPKNVPKGRQVVDVVVDPILTQHLREHQRDGVKFMYECVMGMRKFDGQGAILADEMGLGKTLQTITLLWTLLKQNPIYEDPPIIKKALIVCPVTLINNWRKEFRKWLGNERIGVFVADGTKTRLTDFTMGRNYNIMIIGYEKLRTVQEELKKGPGIDIVIADEGHRLKTAKNKSAQAIKSLNTPRRIILSGTPIQNDLGEFFMMVDFVNPDLLGTYKTFTKEFAMPIEKSRQPGALQKDVDKGEARSEELSDLTAMFILRRTAEILSKYLPSKTEYVLFCSPTEAQASAYQHVLACPTFQAALGNSEASLQLITVLKKVCNSPSLLNKIAADPAKPLSPMTISLLASIPPHLLRTNAGSTKLRALDQLLHALRTTTSEKIILVSNYTSTLDLLSTLLTSLGLPFLRLDGSTPSSKRQDLVDSFNRSPASISFAFLLSAKSGGVGLNLIGASRLVLFDVDWNPATDLQAMARIHRDGQKRPCFIYRFVMKGGLDEKIWQRQVTKLGLASSVMDQKGGASSFSRDELRDLFRLDLGDSCQTHNLLGCSCGGRGFGEAAIVAEDDINNVGPFKPIDDASIQILDTDDEDETFARPRHPLRVSPTRHDIDDDLPTLPSLLSTPTLFTPSNRIDMEKQERAISVASSTSSKSAKKGDSMQSLMQYSHIDTSRFSSGDEGVEALIEDEVLRNVLGDEGNRIDFVFAKMTC